MTTICVILWPRNSCILLWLTAKCDGIVRHDTFLAWPFLLGVGQYHLPLMLLPSSLPTSLPPPSLSPSLLPSLPSSLPPSLFPLSLPPLLPPSLPPFSSSLPPSLPPLPSFNPFDIPPETRLMMRSIPYFQLRGYENLPDISRVKARVDSRNTK